MKNKKKIIILGSLLVISLLIGLTYAYYKFSISQQGTNIVKADCFEFEIVDKNAINLRETIPLSDEEGKELEPYEFTIKNKCSLAADYQVNLEVIDESTLSTTYVRYSIDESEAKTVGNQEEVTVYVNDNIKESRKLLTGTIQPYKSNTYKLRMWVDENSTIEQSANKTFRSKVVLKAAMNNKTNNLIVMRNNETKLVEDKVNGPRDIGGEYVYDLSDTDITNATNISCNNDAKVTIEDNKLVINHITSDTICKINDTIKSTIDTLDNTKTNIVMIKNEDNVETMTVASTKNVVLDLNGKEINSIGVNETSTELDNNDIVIINSGKLTINDENNEGGIYTGTQQSPFISWGETIINGGNYNGRYTTSLSRTNSYLEINGGIFKSKIYSVLSINNKCQNCKIKINDGTFIGDNRSVIAMETGEGSIITINGGTFTTSGTLSTNNSTNQGTLEINNGTFTSTGRTIENNSGTINITGGNFESTNAETIYNAANGTINISGGIVNSNAYEKTIKNVSSGIININDSNGKVYISNLYTGTSGIWSNASIVNTGIGTINIKGGIADICNENIGINTKGICIYSKQRALYSEVKATGTINVDGAYIVSENNWAVNNYDGIVNVKNSKIVSINDSAINNNCNSHGICDDKAVMNICNNSVNSSSDKYDIYNTHSYGKVNYSSSNIFTNGINNPTKGGINLNNIINTDDACNW